MTHRLLLAALVAVLPWGTLSTASAQNAPPPKKEAPPPDDKDFRPPPRNERPGPRGPRDFDGPMGEGPPREGFGPGPRRPGGPGGPGGPDGPGPGGPGGSGGPRRPGGPEGPPRWPYDSWSSLEQTDPEMYKLLKADHELERECHDLAAQARRAPRDQQAALKKKLEEAIVKHFDARQERRLLEVQRLEEEVKRLRDSIAKRNDGKPQAVSRRVAELLGQDEEPPF